ncbi:carboxypeptidase-like regulatory domain-containing protein [Pareuzebyella sediminis]|uniref:carboxypeptidase-like regulatory domain-containing protein n=1 Tax=Pareuzebyella sediminis TaxID=2607998 RepID=UPI0018E1D2F8|nr:carboxypeptidase-like regulatory domain-containing protein [Pareuzebyella sediminis]
MVFFLCCNASILAQSKIEGYIHDGNTHTPLAYCTIKVIGSKPQYTITNEDGKFEIDSFFIKDSIEIRHLGFKTKKIPLSYFRKEPIVNLEMAVSTLNEVVLTGTRNEAYPYELLDRIIAKYRKHRRKTISKAFLTLNSSARNTPLEHVECFYTAEQSLGNGIERLDVKSGRFGQNRSFSFYSLDNTKILTDFQLFGSSNQILPEYPGNMRTTELRKKYDAILEQCTECNENEVSIGFSPKKNNGRLFSGSLLVDYEQLTVKRIELRIKNPETQLLSSINERVELQPKEILLKVVFNPLNVEEIQYLDFSFRMDYEFENIVHPIESNTFLYFYDYDKPFAAPYFTKSLSFNNDYDKIMALQASESFWETNYQFPKSINDEKSTEFMKAKGYLINYETEIPDRDIRYTDPFVLSWHKNHRLTWNQLLGSNSSIDIQKSNMAWRSGSLDVGKNYDSPFEMNKEKRAKVWNNKVSGAFMVDSFRDIEGNLKIVNRTLLDVSDFHSGYERSKNRLIYLNMIFDIYEIYRQLAASRITTDMSFEEAKSIFEQIYAGATAEVENFKRETYNGNDKEKLMQWNNRIKSKLDVDNFALVR